MTGFRCSACGEVHEGLPMAWGRDAPNAVEAVPLSDRRRRIKLTSDTCVIDGREHFVRACLDLRVRGEAEPFRWLVWVAIPHPAFKQIRSLWRQVRGRAFPPYGGWLATELPYDAPTIGTAVELRDGGAWFRPWAIVRDPKHILAREQRSGIPLERAYELAGRAMHEWAALSKAEAKRGHDAGDEAAET